MFLLSVRVKTVRTFIICDINLMISVMIIRISHVMLIGLICVGQLMMRRNLVNIQLHSVSHSLSEHIILVTFWVQLSHRRTELSMQGVLSFQIVGIDRGWFNR